VPRFIAMHSLKAGALVSTTMTQADVRGLPGKPSMISCCQKLTEEAGITLHAIYLPHPLHTLARDLPSPL
jgi:hypothetical protein